ncbi:MAG: cytochrome c nitrite reductase small subunit [Ignavibacteria bacterium]|nr:cytochrome c nitrite reductase small subunit [Ignavibacteria bacterium]
MGKFYLLISICSGMVIGIGSATFYYAKGYSYMLDDPEVCRNCHVMETQYTSWMKSSHRSVATCNDCHTPDNFTGKWITKALNGFNHSYAFTTDNYKKPIRINQRNIKIAEENCRRCHGMLVSNLTYHETEITRTSCISCHGSVGHLK